MGVYGTIGKFLAHSFLCDGHSVIGIYNNKIDKLSLKITINRNLLV